MERTNDTDRLRHDKRRDCTRYGEMVPVDADDYDPDFGCHRCPSCGAALSDLGDVQNVQGVYV